jgi:hypothetical protein
VRILFDQGTLVPLRQSLMHHEMTTVYPAEEVFAEARRIAK